MGGYCVNPSSPLSTMLCSAGQGFRAARPLGGGRKAAETQKMLKEVNR